MMNSTVCIDASFAVRLLVPDRFSEMAETKWVQWINSNTTIIAPILIVFEASATFRRLVFHKKLSPERGEDVFAQFNRMTIVITHDQQLRTRAWQLAKEFEQSRTYDMSYVAAAELNNCPFWTADERLYNSVRHQLPWVHWIGESASTA